MDAIVNRYEKSDILRPPTFYWCGLILIALSGQLGMAASWPEPMLDDADLVDVFFGDAQHVWAVGDRGIICHSDNGGKSWHRQNSTVDERLNSIFFLNPHNGWAVGGKTLAYTHNSTAIMLKTRDGGRHWVHTDKTLLPSLKRIKMFDSENGWALGNSSPLFPPGLFQTVNGGRTWSTIREGTPGRWLTGDFYDPARGLVAGHDGSLAIASRQILAPVQHTGYGLRHFRSVRLTGPATGWLVGDGGLILTTLDGGRTWQLAGESLERAILELFDFKTVAIIEDHCWIAGAPGTVVFHSADQGQTWQQQPTGINTPIHCLSFADRLRGCAVGALGNILHTDDGGRTWQHVRSGGKRLGMLGLYSQPSQVPLELFVKLAAEEGYLSAVEILGRRDIESPERSSVPLSERTHSALTEVGASGANTAWQFPLRQAGLQLTSEQILNDLDRVNDGLGQTKLEEYIVRKIRQWQPDLVVIDGTSAGPLTPVSKLVQRTVLKAVAKAADATAHVEQRSFAHLQPWQVKKVLSTSSAERSGHLTVVPAQLSTTLGTSFAEQAATARGLLVRNYEPAPTSLGFRLITTTLSADQAVGGFFSGIRLLPGGNARRKQIPPTTDNLQTIRQKTQLRRNVDSLIARAIDNPQSMDIWLGQITDLTRDLSPISAGDMIVQLADNFRQTGRWEAASEMYQLLVDRHGKHPFSSSAALWLVQYYGSSEVQWQLKRGSTFETRQVSVTEPDTDPDRHRVSQITKIPTRQTAVKGRFGHSQSDRWKRATELGRQVARNHPALHASPLFQFPLGVAERHIGNQQTSDHFAKQWTINGTWQQCTQTEHWLNHRRGVPPKPILVCRTTISRPYLDGRLNDEVWQRARRAELVSFQNDDSNWPATAILSYDAHYLYLGITCRKANGCHYPKAKGTRHYDANLDNHDHVELLIDVDRDYSTYYRLALDHRGWTTDTCWQDPNWNPTWYVASDSNESSWSVEIAIPFDELVPHGPAPDVAWALGIQRTVPGVGFQSWSRPAAVEGIPEGMGVLLFD